MLQGAGPQLPTAWPPSLPSQAHSKAHGLASSGLSLYPGVVGPALLSPVLLPSVWETGNAGKEEYPTFPSNEKDKQLHIADIKHLSKGLQGVFLQADLYIVIQARAANKSLHSSYEVFAQAQSLPLIQVLHPLSYT